MQAANSAHSRGRFRALARQARFAAAEGAWLCHREASCAGSHVGPLFLARHPPRLARSRLNNLWGSAAGGSLRPSRALATLFGSCSDGLTGVSGPAILAEGLAKSFGRRGRWMGWIWRLMRGLCWGFWVRMGLRAQIGLAGQYAAVDENLTGKENFEIVGRLYHLGRAPARQRAGELLEHFELRFAEDRLADRIAVVDQGTVIAEGTSDELEARVGGERLVVTVEEGAQPAAAVSALAPALGGRRPRLRRRPRRSASWRSFRSRSLRRRSCRSIRCRTGCRCSRTRIHSGR